jgi:hypothetical protein
MFAKLEARSAVLLFIDQDTKKYEIDLKTAFVSEELGMSWNMMLVILRFGSPFARETRASETQRT